MFKVFRLRSRGDCPRSSGWGGAMDNMGGVLVWVGGGDGGG